MELPQKEGYDSTNDTVQHIAHVQSFMAEIVFALQKASIEHDKSKLQEPEKSIFDIATPKLSALTYGSNEYKAALAELKPALDHHYAANSHHPEHHKNGVGGMTLIDLIEMYCDWKAASLRHNDGNFAESLRINKERFGICEQLAAIFKNTRLDLGW